MNNKSRDRKVPGDVNSNLAMGFHDDEECKYSLI